MKYSKPIYLVAAGRSPVGRLGGVLKSLTATDLALPVAEAIVPAALKPAIEQVILGQVLQAGTGMNVARQLGLRLNLPQTTPACTVNMVCASGLKAVALAADTVAGGESSLVLAGGVESMSRAPHYAMDLRSGKKLGAAALTDSIIVDGLTDPVLKLEMGETAERIAETFKISRPAQDEFALRSQQRAVANREAFRREIVSIKLLTQLSKTTNIPAPIPHWKNWPSSSPPSARTAPSPLAMPRASTTVRRSCWSRVKTR